MHGKLKKLFKNRKCVKRKSSGFTLTEVLVASTLLIVAMVPILKGLTAAHAGSIVIERKTTSLALAKSKLDEITARSIYNYADSFDETNTALTGSYLCNVTDNSAGSNLRMITVSVGQDLNGNNSLANDEIEITLSTYIARRI